MTQPTPKAQILGARQAAIRTRAFLCIGLLIGTAHAADATPADRHARDSIDKLKSAYLACDAASRVRMLSKPEIAACSINAEALWVRGFDRDWNGLLAWWRDATQTQQARNP